MTDIVLCGGTVIDGSGSPPLAADVAAGSGRITAVGDLRGRPAECTLDVRGLVVAPGFIDCHSHSDLHLLEDGLALPKVAQGVTTEIVGNCGMGPFPVRSDDARSAMSALLPSPSGARDRRLFPCLRDFRNELHRNGTAVNVAALVPHGAVRLSVVGGRDRPATEGEVAAMQGLARESIAQGALGMSVGLLYAPGCFTSGEEISALAGALDHRRRIAFHVRNEGEGLEDSVLEAIEIGRRGGAAVHISHLKVADPASWGRVDAALTHIEEASSRGQRVTCDQYPYTAGAAPLQTLLPGWSLEGGTGKLLARLCEPAARERIAAAVGGGEEIPGWDSLARRIGWDRITVGSARGAESWEGRTLATVARESGLSPVEVLFRLLQASGGASVGIYHHMCEEDVKTVLAHPSQVVGSDGLPTRGKCHPRLWGTFPRVLGRYVRTLGTLAIEQAVHKMSGRTAEIFGLRDRGLVRPGYWADLCVFDADQIVDCATYDEPTEEPTGIVHVFCNGVPTMLHGERTEHRPGLWVA